MKFKKIFIGIGVLITLLFIALISVPILFKDDIKQIIDEQLEANVNADVLFDIDNFSVSILSDFPNLTIGVDELGVVGRDKFAGELLFAIKQLEVEVNLWKMIFDSRLTVQGIYLTEPQIFIKVLADGSANYDIAISNDEDEPKVAEDGGASDFIIAIDHWSIGNGHVIYDDATLPTYLELTGINHSGSGDFSMTIFDLATKTQAHINMVSYDDIEYIKNRDVALDLILNMDLDQMRFEFMENTLAVNEFALGFNGWVAMPDDDIAMDLSFETQNNSFKSLLSLIPAFYLSDFDDLESSGEIQFDGKVKGVYNDVTLPSYDLNLAVKDGYLHYPDLPEAISNVQVQMNIASPDGDVDKTSINISNFHIDFGKEPFDGHLKVDNLVTYPIDLRIKTNLNLANVAKLYPVEGLSLSGSLAADISANGKYDSITSEIPKIDASLKLTEGEVAYPDLPTSLSSINIAANAQNSSGVLNDTKFAVPDFSFSIDNQLIHGDLLLEEFDNIHWVSNLNGDLDFNKLFPLINKIYPMPGSELSGNIMAEFSSEGEMSDVDSERYERIKSSGKLVFNNFYYADSALFPQGIKIMDGSFAFNPNLVTVQKITTKVGASDFEFDGTVSNYLNYIFNDEIIQGKLAMKSSLIDVNEFMTDEVVAEEQAETEELEAPYEVVEVPKNINFVFQATIDRIKYDNIVLSDASGKILVHDGMLFLDQLRTSTLGGVITFDGNYNTQNLARPKFAMQLNVADVEISQTYEAFNTVQLLAPIAKNVSGNVSTKFSLNGLLEPDMMPDLSSLTGGGLLKVKQAEIKDSELVAGITQYIKGQGSTNLAIQDVAMYVEIEDGKIKVKPFDLKIKNSTANISGTSGVDGSIDYQVKLDVPAGQLGSKVNSLLGSITGTENNSEIIKLNVGLGGTYLKPEFKLLGLDAKDVAKKTAITQAATLAGGDSKLADSLANTNIDTLIADQKKIAEAEIKRRQDSLKIAAEAEAEKAKKKALEEANKQLKNLFGPKKKKN